MRKLSPDFRFDEGVLESKLKAAVKDLEEREFDRDFFREKLFSEGFEPVKLKPKQPRKASFLSVDAALVKKELRHHALWGTHCVVLYSEFDGRKHPDPLAQGNISYGGLKYDSFPDLGFFWPYRHFESRSNSARIIQEYSSILRSNQELLSSGEKPTYHLIDGSLQTTVRRLKDEARRSGFPEHKKALEFHNELVGAGKVVGLVEDSHSSDIAKKLGLDVTNTAILDLLLEEDEFVVQKKDGINVCHLKLGSKKLAYTHSGVSEPLLVRWEFSYDVFEEDLAALAGLWLLEDDIWHPQIYPLRVTDYLTRRLRIGGLLDALIAENGLDLKYREMRED